MKKLEDFQDKRISKPEEIKGGGFVHTQVPGWWGVGFTDVYYDKNNNGTCDDNERGSFNFAYVSEMD